MEMNKLNKEFADTLSDKVSLLFYKEYSQYIKVNEHWSVSFNTFIMKEFEKINEKFDRSLMPFTKDEVSDIIILTYEKIFNKINIDNDEYERYEKIIDWISLDEIFAYYSTL